MSDTVPIDFSKALEHLQNAISSLDATCAKAPYPILAQYRLRHDIAKLRDDLRRLDGRTLPADLSGSRF